LKKQNVVKLGFLSLAVLAWATFAPSASAGVIGTLFSGSSGEITVTTNSITWNTDPGSISAGTWNGEVANGTNLTFQGCTGGLGSAGCLFNGEGIDINHLAALVNGVTPIPIDGFLLFAANPALDFTLTAISPGSANTNCSGLSIGQSCSVFVGSPIILTLLTSNRTSVQLSMLGTATDGSGLTSNWTGGFSATIPTMTPAQIEAFFGANPNGSISASNSGSFFATTVPEPVSMALIGGGLLALAVIKRRKRV
jgi:PEP-CTERM motif